jgi:hypothetical protein
LDKTSCYRAALVQVLGAAKLGECHERMGTFEAAGLAIGCDSEAPKAFSGGSASGAEEEAGSIAGAASECAGSEGDSATSSVSGDVAAGAAGAWVDSRRADKASTNKSTILFA